MSSGGLRTRQAKLPYQKGQKDGKAKGKTRNEEWEKAGYQA
jgi:hypothetical protein